MHLKKDYTNHTLQLNPDYEGDVIAVLTSSDFNKGNRTSILYLHGYVDYFFHPHLKNDSASVLILAHSTGGLTASRYMNFGNKRDLIDGLILNSPFLDFNQSKLEKIFSVFAAKVISRFSDYAKIEGALSPVYAQSVHKDFKGEWDFNLEWKPIEGFPTYFMWIAAIARAQEKLKNSNIKVPVLVMHSSGSIRTSEYSDEIMSNDIVLNIEDIKRVGKKLGDNVTLIEIDGAQHDIFLSRKAVREEGFDKMFDWLSNTDFKK